MSVGAFPSGSLFKCVLAKCYCLLAFCDKMIFLSAWRRGVVQKDTADKKASGMIFSGEKTAVGM